MSGNQFLRTNATSRDSVRGLVCTAFIKNGNYYGTEIEVYEDGAFECWGMVDRAFLDEKILRNWISSSVPDGRQVSAHHLGQWKVAHGKWELNQDSLRHRLLEMLRKLNPQMSGLVDFEGSDNEIRDGLNCSKMGVSNGRPAMGPDEAPDRGESTWVFVRRDDLFHLTSMRIYANGLVDIDPRAGRETLVEFGSVPDLLQSRKLTVRVPEGKW
ncbi:MAG: hypothetical protein JWM11_7643, partial [Planctomycetaceae bacterium]|nr:hypothetical protein [Planctomycetaceae bacterium]